jgi:SulP family sulfate permease
MVFLCAFGLTVVVDLPTAVGASLILASALLVKRLSEATHVNVDDEVTSAGAPGQAKAGKEIPDGVMVFRIFGAFFFGAADKLETSLREAGQLPDVLILRMRDVLALDATGLDALEDLMEKLRKHKKELILCAPHSQPLFAMVKAGFLDRIGRENVCANVDESLNRARQLLGRKSPPQSGDAHLKM